MNRAATLRFFLSLATLASAGGCIDFEKLGYDYCTRNRDVCPLNDIPFVDKAASGGNHTLALGVDRSVWALGQNTDGQLGNGTTEGSPVPRKVEGLEPCTQVAAGLRHSMALTGGGRVMLWGTLGTQPIQLTPTPVPGLENMTDIAAGASHALALTDQGEVWAWGSGPAGLESATPVKVTIPADSIIVQIAAGNAHSLVLSRNGQVWAWGDNSRGQLGPGDSAGSMTPRRVQGLPSGTKKLIVAGGYHSLVLTDTDQVWAWGDNSRGQLGDGSTTSSSTPVRTRFSNPFTATTLAAGAYHSLAANLTTNAVAWGDNSKDQLGIDPGLKLASTPLPLDVKVVDNAQRLAARESSSLVVTSAGCLSGWGSNEQGQLGLFNGVQERTFQYPTPILCKTPVHQPSGK